MEIDIKQKKGLHAWMEIQGIKKINHHSMFHNKVNLWTIPGGEDENDTALSTTTN